MTYLLKIWGSLFSNPDTLKELCGKLAIEFSGLNRVSKSTILRKLKEDFSVGFCELWIASPKIKDMQEILKRTKYALLLKKLEYLKLERIWWVKFCKKEL